MGVFIKCIIDSPRKNILAPFCLFEQYRCYLVLPLNSKADMAMNIL